MMRTGDMQTQHPVMSCPVCEETIHAEVTVKPNLGAAVVAADGKSVNVPVEAEMTRFNLSHHCKGRVYAVADTAGVDATTCAPTAEPTERKSR